MLETTELSGLNQAPVRPEPLGRGLLQPDKPVEVPGLRLCLREASFPAWMEHLRQLAMGEGAKAWELEGLLLPSPDRSDSSRARTHPVTLDLPMPPAILRLGSLRWAILCCGGTDDEPWVDVLVDRMASERAARGPGLAPNQARSFSLTTVGIESLELRFPHDAPGYSYDDYVQVELSVSPEAALASPWSAVVTARRCLASYEMVTATARLGGVALPCRLELGDHTLEVLSLSVAEGAGLEPGAPSTRLPEALAQLRLFRKEKVEGMTPKQDRPSEGVLLGRALRVGGQARTARLQRGRQRGG